MKLFLFWLVNWLYPVTVPEPIDNEAGLVLTGTRILIRPTKIEEKTSGGIVLASSIVEKEERAATTGELIDAAHDAWLVRAMRGVKRGDTIFHARYAGDNVTFLQAGVTYRVMNAEDVVGVVKKQFDSQFQAARSTTETFGIVEDGAKPMARVA